MSDDIMTEESPETPTSPPGPRRVALSGGGWAELNTDLEMLTGKDVRRIREALNLDGDGTVANELRARALTVCITGWAIPYRPELDIPSRLKTPMQALEILNGRDLRTLEVAVDDLIKELTNPPAASGPPLPASE